jgi:hypothetical protein
MKEGKQAIIDFPAIDEERFCPYCDKWEIKPEYVGKINGLICDPGRDDIDRFDLFVGAWNACKVIPGLKWHFFGLDTPFNTAEERMLWQIERIGGLGTRIGRVTEMERVYRAFDFLVTPHTIVTQIVGEAVACKLPIIAPVGNPVASQEIQIRDPSDLVYAIQHHDMFCNKGILKLREFGEKMNNIYINEKDDTDTDTDTVILYDDNDDNNIISGVGWYSSARY